MVHIMLIRCSIHDAQGHGNMVQIVLILCSMHDTQEHGSTIQITLIRSSIHDTQGHGNMVQIHPSSNLFGRETELDWCMYHEVVVTTKTYLRTVTPIQVEWVEHLLPKLHEVRWCIRTGNQNQVNFNPLVLHA